MSIAKNQISHYLQETLAVNVAPEISRPGRRLPIFLRDGYTFYEFDLLSNRCLVMVDRAWTGLRPRSASILSRFSVNGIASSSMSAMRQPRYGGAEAWGAGSMDSMMVEGIPPGNAGGWR